MYFVTKHTLSRVNVVMNAAGVVNTGKYKCEKIVIFAYEFECVIFEFLSCTKSECSNCFDKLKD